MLRKSSIALLALLISVVAVAQPKNIIVMIGDGCGFEHMLATQYYLCGDEPFPLFDGLSAFAMSTYPVDKPGYDPARAWSEFAYVKEGATDSAASATTMATGIPTIKGTIGKDKDGNRLLLISERAESMGKSSGVVTTVPLCHATPACFAAHATDRNSMKEISTQMIEESPLEVIMGAGHPLYDKSGKQLPGSAVDEDRFNYVGGKETWGGLAAGLAGGDADGDGTADPWTLVESREAFQKLAQGDTPKRVFGVAEAESTTQQGREGDAKADAFAVPRLENVPTLSEMALGALNVLDNDPDGFLLMIEGGAVDWASHGNQSGRMIEEATDFFGAIEEVKKWVEANSSWNDTLLIITADHETGYPCGPGSDPERRPIENRGKGKMPGFEWYTKGHTNNLVPLYAKGAGADALNQYVVGTDPKRGPYVHNAGLGQFMHDLWKAPAGKQ